MAHTVHTRVLRRSAEILGGKQPLREYLRISMRELDAWLAGTEKPPMDVFLKAVDIISAAPLPPLEAVQRARELRQKSRALLNKAAELHVRVAAAQQEMLEAALESAIEVTRADMGNVQIACPEGLRIVAHRGFEKPFLDFFAVVDHASAASCGAALKMARRVVVTEVATDPIFVDTEAAEILARAGVRSVQSTPLLGQSGQLFGMLSTHSSSPDNFAPEHAALDQIARRATVSLEGASI